MQKWKTKSSVEVVQVLDGRSNAYLIHSEEGTILVDTGKTSAFERLQNNIQILGFQTKDIKHLILTHTHFDHCQNAHVIKRLSNCKIWVSEQESEFVVHGYTPLPKGTILFSRMISGLEGLIGKKQFGYKPFTPEVVIAGQTDLDNFPVRVLPTPGHSEGSVSVIVDNEIALVGDALFGVFRKSVLSPFADDFRQLVSSWGTLLGSGCHTFLPGHGKEIKRNLLESEFIKYSRK